MTPKLLLRIATFLVLTCICAPGDALQVWHRRSPLPTQETLRAAAHGAGRFVGVGDYGTIVTSSNGVDWVLCESFTSQDLTTVTFGNGLFLAGGRQGTLLRSEDGLHWSSGQSPFPTHDVTVVGFGAGTNFPAGRFVAMTLSNSFGQSVRGMYSANGVDWTTDVSIQDSSSSPFKCIAFGNSWCLVSGIFVSGSSYPPRALCSLTGGASWSPAHPPLDGPVAFGNGLFLVARSFSVVSNRISVLGTTAGNPPFFPAIPDGGVYMARAAVYGANSFVVVGDGGCVGASADGTNWTGSRIAPERALYATVHGNGVYVAMGQGGYIASSSDGISWVVRSKGIVDSLFDVAPAGDGFMTVGANGLIAHSSSGEEWEKLPSPTTNTLRTAFHANGRFVLGGDNGTLLSGESLTNLALQSSGTLDSLIAIAFGNGNFVAVGANGVALTSQDTVAWTLATTGATNPLSAMTFGAGRFVAAGYNGSLYSSADGQTWVRENSGTTRRMLDIKYARGRFVAAGGLSTGRGPFLITSEDGAAWTAPTNVPVTSGALAFGSGLFLASGFLIYNSTLTTPVASVLYNSTDGLNWSQFQITNNWPTISRIATSNGRFVSISTFGRISQTEAIVHVRIAQTNRAEISIDGPSAGVYRIDGLDSHRDSDLWRPLTTLSNAPYTWIDPDTAIMTNRLYRAVLLP